MHHPEHKKDYPCCHHCVEYASINQNRKLRRFSGNGLHWGVRRDDVFTIFLSQTEMNQSKQDSPQTEGGSNFLSWRHIGTGDCMRMLRVDSLQVTMRWEHKNTAWEEENTHTGIGQRKPCKTRGRPQTPWRPRSHVCVFRAHHGLAPTAWECAGAVDATFWHPWWRPG